MSENKTESKNAKAEAPKGGAQADAAAHNPFTAFDPMAIWNAFQTSMNAWTSSLPGFGAQTTAANPASASAAGAAWANPFTAWQQVMQNANPVTMWQQVMQNANPMNLWQQILQGQATANPWAAGQQTFTKLAADSVARAEAFSEEYATIEAQMVSRANAAVDHWAQLAHDSINYSAQLSAQARKLTFEAARKASNATGSHPGAA